jgi:hypothetical protein
MDWISNMLNDCPSISLAPNIHSDNPKRFLFLPVSPNFFIFSCFKPMMQGSNNILKCIFQWRYIMKELQKNECNPWSSEENNIF